VDSEHLEDSIKPADLSVEPENGDAANSATAQKDEDRQEDHGDDEHLEDEHHGETVVEAEEDTVIY
jgi:hypothetical protein